MFTGGVTSRGLNVRGINYTKGESPTVCGVYLTSRCAVRTRGDRGSLVRRVIGADDGPIPAVPRSFCDGGRSLLRPPTICDCPTPSCATAARRRSALSSSGDEGQELGADDGPLSTAARTRRWTPSVAGRTIWRCQTSPDAARSTAQRRGGGTGGADSIEGRRSFMTTCWLARPTSPLSLKTAVSSNGPLLDGASEPVDDERQLLLDGSLGDAAATRLTSPAVIFLPVGGDPTSSDDKRQTCITTDNSTLRRLFTIIYL